LNKNQNCLRRKIITFKNNGNNVNVNVNTNYFRPSLTGSKFFTPNAKSSFKDIQEHKIISSEKQPTEQMQINNNFIRPFTAPEEAFFPGANISAHNNFSANKETHTKQLEQFNKTLGHPFINSHIKNKSKNENEFLPSIQQKETILTQQTPKENKNMFCKSLQNFHLSKNASRPNTVSDGDFLFKRLIKNLGSNKKLTIHDLK